MYITKKSVGLLAFALCASVLFLSGCKKKTESAEKTYTYRITSLAPNTWSPTDYQMGYEATIYDFASDGLYRYVLNEAKDDVDIICSMATELPIDVTADYAGNTIYNIPLDAQKGYAWRFNFRNDITWQDGTPINADTFEYSLKQFLNPQMKNYRASGYYSDNMVIANA